MDTAASGQLTVHFSFWVFVSAPVQFQFWFEPVWTGSHHHILNSNRFTFLKKKSWIFEPVVNHKHLVLSGSYTMFPLIFNNRWFKRLWIAFNLDALSCEHSTSSNFYIIIRFHLWKKCFWFNILVHLVWTNMTMI